jgi:hypothetical protein
LSDVASNGDIIGKLRKSRWFTRGWTLQELLAPRQIVFFAKGWVPIGYTANSGIFENTVDWRSSIEFMKELSSITKIPSDYLSGRRRVWDACIAQRMFWASYRETARAEDRAYSLMGLFDISMPVLYSEGLDKAFTRLQHEIIRRTEDQTFLAWYRSNETSFRLLADSPDCFRNSGAVVLPDQLHLRSPFSMTNLGLRIALPTTWKGKSLNYETEARLECVVVEDGDIARGLGINLIFRSNDYEGHPVFICHRPREWLFSTVVGEPKAMFVHGTDYESEIPRVPEKDVR